MEAHHEVVGAPQTGGGAVRVRAEGFRFWIEPDEFALIASRFLIVSPMLAW